MVTKSFTSLRRFSGHALTMMLFCVSMSKGAEAQATPSISASYSIGLSHPTGLGTLEQGALDTFGDWIFADASNGGLYELPVGTTTVITLAPTGTLTNHNPGVAIDSNNNLYLEGNYNNCVLMFPYDPATKTWDGLSTLSATNTTEDVCPNAGGGTSPYIFAQYGLTVSSPSGKWQGYFQPWGIAVDKNNNLVIGAQNSTPFIFTLNVVGSGAAATPGTGTLIVDKMTARPVSVAADQAGNIYFVEDSGGLSGVYEVPAGNTDLASDTDSSIVRVDPNLPSVVGVTTDSAGNLYISDSTKGVFFVPNSTGTPQTANAILLSPLPAQGEALPDLTRDLLYVPTTQEQSNSQADIAEVSFITAMLGSVATSGPAATPQSIAFGFNVSETPNSFVIQEAGAAAPDFTIASGGTCNAGTAYAAQTSCTVNVTLSPHTAGSVSAKLLMLDSSSNVLASMPLSGVGDGSAIQLSPGTQATIDSGLITPTQIVVDAAANTYVADPGFTAVQMFAKGSSTATAVGTGLTAPSGVAVDGAGDVFIADGGSGTVVEVPNGPNGLVTAGQVTLKSGLGASLQLALDALGNLYIADPTNGRVVKLNNAGLALGAFTQSETDITGFTTPSVITVDPNNNLDVLDSGNLFQVTPAGVQTTLLSGLNAASGAAVDASGSLYLAQSGGTVRIPNQSGTLNPSAETIVAASVTSPTSVALDHSQNVYITDGVGKDVVVVEANASNNFGTLSSPSDTASANFTILNVGNLPLNISGFTGTADYIGASSNCSGTPIALSATCAFTVTFSPGPGDQGPLSGEVVVQSDAANSPIGVSATGVGAPLAGSTTKFTTSNPNVNGAPAVITVTPTTGTTPVPTGQVNLTVTGNGITPVVLSGTLSNGTITLTPTNLPAATYQFAVQYVGDRVYGSSTSTSSVKVGAGAVALSQPTLSQIQKQNPFYPYVLSGQSGSNEPYDGSVTQFVEMAYYTVTVIPTNGQPLIGQPVYDSTGTKVIGTNYGSVTFQGASTSTCAPIPVQSNGTAQFDPSCLAIDTSNSSIPNILTTYTVTPQYSPTGTGSASSYTNPNYTAFTGTSINYTALRNPLVSVSSNPTSLTVGTGSSVTATLSLSSVLGYGIAGQNSLLNNYSLPVQLACDGLPAYATCTFVYPNPDPSDPNSVHVGPTPGTVLSIQGATAAPCTVAQGCSGPGTVMMTITTNVPTGVAMLRGRPTGTVFLAMLGLGALGFALGRKRSLRARLGTLAVLTLCCGMLAGASGCSTTQLGGVTAQVTPAGTYTVQVTAKQVGSQVITQNPYITYGNGNQMSLPFTMQVTIQ
jgi:sugar lactone lactonase YvrE